MTAAVIYPLLCCAFFYLGAQAKITEALWSRYPGWFDSYMSCAACTGFLYGLGCAGLGWWQHWPFLSLDGRHWLTPLVVAFCSIVWTPILVARHTSAMTGDSFLGDTADIIPIKKTDP